jgi:hypothetical protein
MASAMFWSCETTPQLRDDLYRLVMHPQHISGRTTSRGRITPGKKQIPIHQIAKSLKIGVRTVSKILAAA